MKKRKDIDDRTWKLVRKIAKNIRRIRTEKGLTQEKMEDLGFGPRWYQRFETGRYIPTIPTLDRLARAFRVEIGDFFANADHGYSISVRLVPKEFKSLWQGFSGAARPAIPQA